VVDAGKRDVRVCGRHLDRRRSEQEPDRNDELVPVVHGGLQVRLVVVGRLRHVDALLDVEVRLGLLEAVDGEFVEAAVVDTARVGDEGDLDAVAAVPTAVIVAAASGRSESQQECRQHHQEPRHPSFLCH
jgi:hypothetical protein